MEFADNENDHDLARMKIDPQEYEIIRSSLQILEDISLVAEGLDDMKSDVATDIYQTCLMMRRKVARIVQAKSFLNHDIERVADLLEIIDYIDQKMGQYKKKYLKMKEKALKAIQKQTQEIIDGERESEKEKKDKEERRKQKKDKKKREMEQEK